MVRLLFSCFRLLSIGCKNYITITYFQIRDYDTQKKILCRSVPVIPGRMDGSVQVHIFFSF